jgi:hypothetical protein
MDNSKSFKERAEIVRQRIESDFSNSKNIENIIDEFKGDQRTIAFIKYYNSIVLDNEKIDFGTFKSKWAIQGMTREVYSFFNNNFDKLRDEIINDKNIDSFYKNYCCTERNETIFCCKLFHVILPHEFPPIDNNIIKHFKLNERNKMNSYKIIKYGYELFISKNEDIINQIKKVLLKDEYKYIRIKELSNYRILDMIYWFILNRRNGI